MNVSQVTNALNSASIHEPSARLQQRLLEFYPRLVPSIFAALEARSKDRMDGIQKLLTERSDFETRSIETILQELANSIRKELDEPEVMQLELFTSEEKEQLNRNTDSLRRRLAAIPYEIEQERKLIQSRFSDPQTRMFPVAIAFLIPQNKAQ